MNQVGDQGGNHHYEGDGSCHAYGSFHFAGYPDKGTNSKELVEYDVADKYSGYNY
jgi:hypothetical protein